MNAFDKYGKAIVAVLMAVITAGTAAMSNGRVTPLEWVQITIAGVTALLVYLVPVVPEWPHAKSVIGGVLALLNVLATLIVGGWHSGSVSEMILAGLTAFLVRFSPATSTVKPGGVAAE